MATRIRYQSTGSLSRPTIDSRGQEVAGTGTTVKLAFFYETVLTVAPDTGEQRATVPMAFFKPATDVAVRDHLTVTGVSGTFQVMRLVPALDDRATLDHYRADLAELV